jgi:hypothetical protein
MTAGQAISLMECRGAGPPVLRDSSVAVASGCPYEGAVSTDLCKHRGRGPDAQSGRRRPASPTPSPSRGSDGACASSSAPSRVRASDVPACFPPVQGTWKAVKGRCAWPSGSLRWRVLARGHTALSSQAPEGRWDREDGPVVACLRFIPATRPACPPRPAGAPRTRCAWPAASWPGAATLSPPTRAPVSECEGREPRKAKDDSEEEMPGRGLFRRASPST